MIVHSLLFITASCSVGYVLLLLFYWHQMRALVPFINIYMGAPTILLIFAIIGLVLSFF